MTRNLHSILIAISFLILPKLIWSDACAKLESSNARVKTVKNFEMRSHYSNKTHIVAQKLELSSDTVPKAYIYLWLLKTPGPPVGKEFENIQIQPVMAEMAEAGYIDFLKNYSKHRKRDGVIDHYADLKPQDLSELSKVADFYRLYRARCEEER